MRKNRLWRLLGMGKALVSLVLQTGRAGWFADSECRMWAELRCPRVGRELQASSQWPVAGAEPPVRAVPEVFFGEAQKPGKEILKQLAG